MSVTEADRAWAACDARCVKLRAGSARGWSVRDIIILAEEDFAEHWATRWDFGIFDPNDTKELARWISRYLEAADVVVSR